METIGVDPGSDQRIRLHGVSWDDYDRLLGMRGEGAAVRITYLHGEVELMSPSRRHEWIARAIGRLVETWAEERGIPLNALGSWTVRKRRADRGLEPDGCYVLGSEEKERPDLAIEVVVTSGAIEKLEVYRGLLVPEVWIWTDGRIVVHRLGDEGYEQAASSALLPGLDLETVARLAESPDQTQAVREFRASIRR